MAKNPRPPLSRRERQIMDIIYARGEATAAQVREDLAGDAPSYSAVRGLIRVLEQKGHLKHRREGVRNVYLPTRHHVRAGQTALRRVLEIFYKGDVHQAVSALLNVSDARLSTRDIGRIRALIEKAKKEGR